MKFLFIAIIGISVLFIETSCNKHDNDQSDNCLAVPRKIRFSLYTRKDFSENNDIITFTLSIRTAASRVLWDSVLPAMKIKDIPGFSNKLVFEKQVPGNDCSLLKVGFIYSIESAGISWFWDKSDPGETFKNVEFDFK